MSAVKPGSTEHLVLLAARPSGRIETSALTQRFGFNPSNAITNLVRAGLIARATDYKDVILTLTPAGRAACPARRDIPLTPLHARSHA
ncbi:MAG: hypothetical protein U1E96_08865 [Azonexus sp.]